MEMVFQANPVKWLISGKQAAKHTVVQPGPTLAPETAPLEPADSVPERAESLDKSLFTKSFQRESLEKVDESRISTQALKLWLLPFFALSTDTALSAAVKAGAGSQSQPR